MGAEVYVVQRSARRRFGRATGSQPVGVGPPFGHCNFAADRAGIALLIVGEGQTAAPSGASRE
jgi:hypothetical protein